MLKQDLQIPVLMIALIIALCTGEMIWFISGLLINLFFL